MARSITIVGWHIHPEAGVCEHCGASAAYMIEDEDYNVFNLCQSCAESDLYEIKQDKVAKVFEDLGF